MFRCLPVTVGKRSASLEIERAELDQYRKDLNEEYRIMKMPRFDV